MVDDIRMVLKLLRDFSFRELITPLIIRVLYRVGILAAAVLVISQIINAFRVTEGRGIFMLIFGVVVLFPFYVMVLRVGLEIVMALFQKAAGTPVVVASAEERLEPPPAVEQPATQAEEPGS